jgi:hypothetical protein
MTTRNWISICIEVADIAASIEVYSNRWQLFKLVNKGGAGADEFATLELIDPMPLFRLGLYKERALDSIGRPIPSAKHARISLPKSGFWTWVDQVFGNRDCVESTPWSADLILRDTDGHMFVVYTTEPPASPPSTPRG